MGDTTNTRPGRFGRRLIQGLVLLILIFVCLEAYKLWDVFWPHSFQVTISPETTVLTGPLDADGLVDYTAAIDQQDSQGVTPENNAAVLLVQVLPEQDWKALPPALLRAIGAPTTRPADAPRLVPFDEDFFRPLPGEAVPTSMPADDPPIPGRPVKPMPAPAPPMGPGPEMPMGPGFGPGPGPALPPAAPSPTPASEPSTEPSAEAASGPAEAPVAAPPGPGPSPAPMPPGFGPGPGPGPRPDLPAPGPGAFPGPIGPGFGPGFGPWTPPTPPPPTVQDMLWKQYQLAGKRPWTAKEFPALALWLERNAPVVPVLLEASKRARLFAPYEGFRWGRIAQNADMLALRALLAAGEGRFDEARDDMLAMHRLARLQATRTQGLGYLVAAGIEEEALDATSSLLVHSENFSWAGAWLAAVGELGPFPDPTKAAVESRYWALHRLSACAKWGFARGYQNLDEGDQSIRRIPHVRRDWDTDLRTINALMDQLAEACHDTDYTKSQATFLRLQSMTHGSEPFISRVTKYPADCIVAEQTLVIRQMHERFCNLRMRFQLNRLGLALAAYHADTGKWPATLDELAPKYVKEIPQDCFTGQPLVYRSDAGGYLLYSLGARGVDLGGDEEGGNLVVSHRTAVASALAK